MTSTTRLLSVVASLCVMAACGAPARDAQSGALRPGPSSWQQTAVEAAATAMTAFGRAVLQDGVVTRDEYDQSIRLLIECGRARGVEIEATQRHGIYVFSTAGEAGDAVFRQCSEGDLGLVQAIFYGMYADPDNRGNVVTADCLVAEGLLPITYRFDASTFNDEIDRLVRSWPRDSPAHDLYDQCVYDPMGHSER